MRSAFLFRALLVACLMVMVAPLKAYSQTQVGIQPFGTYTQGVDQVSIGDLGLHVAIPLYSHGERGSGTGLAFSLVYNGITIGSSGGSFGPESLLSLWNQTGGLAGIGGVQAQQTTSDSPVQNCGDKTNGITQFNNYTYVDSSGFPHYFPHAGSYYDYCTHVTTVSGVPDTATDGSGYVLTQASLTDTQVVMPSGVTFTSNSSGFIATANHEFPTITDTNGNSTIQAAYQGSSSTTPDNTYVSALTNSISYRDTTGQIQTVSINYKQYQIYQTGTNSTGQPVGPTPTNFIDSVVYPDGTAYRFSYEPAPQYPGCYTGRLSSMQLPTGGTIQYSYTDDTYHANASSSYDYIKSFTRTGPDGTVTYNRQLTAFSAPDPRATSPNFVYPIASTTTVVTADSTSVYNFVGTTSTYQIYEATYQGANANLSQGYPAQATTTCYAGVGQSCNNHNFTYPIVEKDTSKSLNGGYSSKTVELYNSVGLPTETDIYDYGTGAAPGPGPLLSKTLTQYAALGNNIQDRPSSVIVQDGSGNIVSKTTYGYDEYSLVQSHASNLSPVSGARGNRTSTHVLVSNGSSTTLDSQARYDDAGQVIATSDANQNTTQYTYDAATDSCLNKTTYPKSSTGFVPVVSQICEPNTGLPISSTDPNQVTTAYSYDAMLRPAGTTVTSGGNTYASTSIAYSGSTLPETITKTVLATPDPNQVTTTTLDGFGRTSSVVEPNGATVATTYDARGRVQSITNPYLSTSDPTYGITSYLYDAVGRKTAECEPDNSSAPSTTCTPSNSYQSWRYSGGLTIYQDQNGHTWQQTSDALGRLIKVLEPNPTDGYDTLETDYAYDALNNTTQIDQWGGYNPAYGSDAATCLSPGGQSASGASCDRMRTFRYDGASRMILASNPESGTTTYSYDPNSNLQTKTDANGVVTTYSYDGLNRLTGKDYSDGTPTVSYHYDAPLQGWNFIDQTFPAWSGNLQTNVAGRLSYASTSGSTIVYGYDPVGRTTLKSECTPSTCGTDHFDMHAVYDAAGNPRFVDRGFDAVLNAATPNAGYYYGGLSMAYNGAGQLSSAAADISDPAHPATLLQNVTYTPTGQEQTAELSSQYGQVSQYDNRSRRTSRYSANLNGQVVIGDSWSYDKVSNVTSAADSLQGSFNYTYDTLNRVTQATFGGITMNYGYDPWGNQTSHTVTQGSSYQWSFMPTSQNRATVTGSAYDAAGNMLADGTHQYTYNAEGQVAAVTDQGVSYVYDAEGKRIATYNGGTGAAHETAEYLNDMAGNLVVTLNPNHTMVRGILRDNLETHRGDYVGGPQGGAGSSEFRLVNQVGTLVANASSEGNFVEGCLSGPFGDGQLCTSDYNYTETHFTDKLRDKESNNDYFGARYFNSTLGRFTSPDPSGLGYADPSNPQSLNAYSYVHNNPLSNIDPSGLGCESDIGTDANDSGPAPPTPSVSCQNADQQTSQAFQTVYEEVNVHAQIDYGSAFLGLYTFVSVSVGIPYQYANAPSNGIGQQVPVHGPWTYGNHCGAGGMGPDVNSTDGACHVHDDCFDAIHLTADQYTSGQASPAQVQGAAACNQQLCNSVLNVNRGSGVPLSQRWAGAEIILFFSLTGPKGAQCHGF